MNSTIKVNWFMKKYKEKWLNEIEARMNEFWIIKTFSSAYQQFDLINKIFAFVKENFNF